MARSKLSRDKVLKAALALIDERGLEALSMRRLGDVLGVEAMSLYRHIANKADLLNGVQGLILTELGEAPGGLSWRPWLRERAVAFRRLLRSHPRALPLFATRPAVEHIALAQVEAALAILEGAGFPPERCIIIFHTVLAFVLGSASLQFGVDEDLGPDIDYRALPAQDFPRLARLGAQFQQLDDDQEFEFGLETLIAGLEDSLEKSQRRA